MNFCAKKVSHIQLDVTIKTRIKGKVFQIHKLKILNLMNILTVHLDVTVKKDDISVYFGQKIKICIFRKYVELHYELLMKKALSKSTWKCTLELLVSKKFFCEKLYFGIAFVRIISGQKWCCRKNIFNNFKF